jgi:hypothetical protein
MKSKREELRRRQQRQKLIKRTGWSALAVIAIGLVGVVVWQITRPSAGEAVPVMADISHVEETTDPGPYNSEPPTSGRHYASSLEAGFYQEEDLQRYLPHPEGLLVHSLEHGYVIFWYNCETLDASACQTLKEQIQGVMEAVGNAKVIAFPRPGQAEPVVMTSWGQLQRFNEFDPQLAQQFVERNRNRAPEPNAP